MIFVCALTKFFSAEIASNQCFLGGFLMVLIWNVKTFKKKKEHQFDVFSTRKHFAKYCQTHDH